MGQVQPARVAGALTLGLLATLVILCVAGAFLGADRASALFTSGPVMVLWAALGTLSLCAVGFSIIGGKASPGQILVHLAVVAILVGSFAGSQRGHQLAARYLKSDKVRVGYMALAEGAASDVICAPDSSGRIGTLPYTLQLNAFRVDYYPPQDPRWKLLLTSVDDGGRVQHVVLNWEVGKKISVRSGTALRVLKYVAPGSGAPQELPAGLPRMEVELEIGGVRTTHMLAPDPITHIGALELPDAQTYGVQAPESCLYLYEPKGMPRSFTSEVVVLRDGRPAGSRSIQVNAPLHYGGYHVYQYSYDPRVPGSTILMVRSDSGVGLVYAGFLLLVLGTVIWAYGEPMWRRVRAARSHGA